VSAHLASSSTRLYTQYINPTSGELSSGTITFGARVDSVYEYFLKQFVLWDGVDNTVADRGYAMYQASMLEMEKMLTGHTSHDRYVYIAEREEKAPHSIGKMDHLVCFMPGLLALGATCKACMLRTPESIRVRHLELARALGRTCYALYEKSPTGLAPEIGQFFEEVYIHHYSLLSVIITYYP
jgi:mannosyl-oligosaccharide alpha-1,2-mannosidase